MNKKIEEFSDKDHSQSENLEEYLDLDIRIGSSAEADHITNNQFLTRGLSEKPIKTFPLYPIPSINIISGLIHLSNPSPLIV